jgi:hypothetical protein
MDPIGVYLRLFFRRFGCGYAALCSFAAISGFGVPYPPEQELSPTVLPPENLKHGDSGPVVEQIETALNFGSPFFGNNPGLRKASGRNE